jgi:amidophosphoribosyltransferase
MLTTECGLLLKYSKNKLCIEYFLDLLDKLQHRGKEACGILYYNVEDTTFENIKYEGLISDVIENIKFKKKIKNKRDKIEKSKLFTGKSNSFTNTISNFFLNKTVETNDKYKNPYIESNIFLGHVRYATSGGKKGMQYIQPYIFEYENEFFSFAFNGNIDILIWEKIYNETKFTNINNLKLLNDGELLREFIKYNINLKAKILKKRYENIDSHNFKNTNNDILNEVCSFTCQNILDSIPTSYCLILISRNKIYCLRDKLGNRPFFYCITSSSMTFSSETCVSIQSNWTPVKPGEMFEIDLDLFEDIDLSSPNKIIKNVNNKQQSNQLTETKLSNKNKNNNNNIQYKSNGNLIDIEDIHKQKFCVFEKIYFMKKNSLLDNYNSVVKYREYLAKLLLIQIKINNPKLHSFFYNYSSQGIKRNDFVVCGVPETGYEYAEEIAKNLNLPYKKIILKRKNASRSFISSNDEERLKVCKNKFELVKHKIKDKHLIISDDTIVRGNTLLYLVRQLRLCMPKSITMLIPAPPVKYQCFYGVDIPTKKELIYNQCYEKFENDTNIVENIKYKLTIDEIKKKLNLDNLEFLNVSVLERNDKNICTHCFSGKDIIDINRNKKNIDDDKKLCSYV